MPLIGSESAVVVPSIKDHLFAVHGTGQHQPAGEMPGFECVLRTVVLPHQNGGMIRMRFLHVSRSNDEQHQAYHFPLTVEIVGPRRCGLKTTLNVSGIGEPIISLPEILAQ